MTEWPRFAFPWVLVLLAAIPWTVWIGARIQSLAPARKWIAIGLRSLILIALILALAGMEWVRTNDELAVFFLLDHSDSVPEGQRLASAQWVRNAADRYMTSDDRAGVIVFGDEASIELGVEPTLGLRDILSYVDGSQTDLAAALRLAMAAFPQGYMKRVVVYSDGNETKGAALEEARLARAAGVEVSVVPLDTGSPEEVRLKTVSAPSRTDAEAPFQLRVVANSTTDTEATLRIFQRVGTERRMLPPQRVNLQQGDNTFVLSQELGAAGFYEYEVSIEADADTVSENNVGQAFTIVHGEPRGLYVTRSAEESVFLEDALREEGVTLDPVYPNDMGASLAALQNYDVVILDDVSSTDLTSQQMTALQAAVRDLGVGLIMVGGPQSFGAGGYLDTPVEAALPVDMDIKQRKILPRGALALILHTMEFADGNAWANEISLAALNALSAQDLMGLLAYNGISGESWLRVLAPVGDKTEMRRAIRQGTSSIGDMPDVGTTLRMAYNALVNADAAAKRVVIISDGDPAAPTPSLLRQLKDAGIAVSTVCINPHSPSDQNMLRGVAEATGGQFYFVNNPQNLPQIFTKEASVVKRGLLIEEPFTPKVQHESELLLGLVDNGLPQLEGYVVTTPKENATVPLVSHEGDPVLAQWRYGLGKAVAFTSDATNRWARAWLAWPGFNRFWAQTVRWATRELTPSDFRVETSVRNGRGYVRIDAVDRQGRFINFLRPHGVVTGPGPDYDRVELDVPQTGPGIYEVSFPLDEKGVYMLNLRYTNPDGTQGTIPAGLALGYSPEYEYTTTNLPLLEEVAATGGGGVMTPDDNPFRHTLQAAPRVTSLWPWLVTVAACLFPVEIFVRRVVVPWSLVAAGVRRALRAIPGLAKVVRAPARRPAPATGAYYAASAEHDFTAEAEAVASFGEAPAAPESVPEAAAPEPAAPEKEAVKKPAQEEAGYTRQLLDAKDRAIKRKSRRIDSNRDDS